MNATRRLALLLILVYALAGLCPADVAVALADQPDPAETAGPAQADAAPSFGAELSRLLRIFFLACLVALVLLVGTVVFLFWRIKKLVENAVRPDFEGLVRLVKKLRRKHPDLDDAALAKKIILRQSNRAGIVGFVTGVGGLPFLPFAIPVDIALTIRIQSNLVHLLRLVRSEEHAGADSFSNASMWLITTGGRELTAASSTLIRDLLVKQLSKSLLKFLPILGAVVGFLLNWISTQALGRLTLKWLAGETEKHDRTTRSVEPAV